MENQDIKEWYIKEYSTDTLGQELNHNITFYDLFETLDNYKNIYKFLGVNDSIVRGRIFKKLSQVMNVDYKYIYEQWLKCEVEIPSII